MRAFVFVGGRADLGPLAPVLDAMARRPGLEVTALTALTFDSDSLRAELTAHGVAARVQVAEVGPLLDGDRAEDLVKCGARMSEGTLRALTDRADALIVLGDRWELPWVVMPAVLLGVPVIHLHGGEVTEGAIDERVRHAVTKLADEHCVASQDAARRLRQLGEEPASIHVTGAPGLDRYRTTPPATDDALAAILGRAVSRPLALFTYHSVTTEPEDIVAENAAAALSAASGVAGQVLVTHPGPDSGRDAVLAAITEVAGRLENVVIVPSLGSLYPCVLAACDIVVGNSSSGVIEAAAVGIPAVDIGRRQSGRLRGVNVLHAEDGFPPVQEAVRQGLDPAFAHSWGQLINPYGDGQASEGIADVIASAGRPARSKRFMDTELDKSKEYR
jgi:UDP-N-acetylglucosamine 2-epimerase (non-hydrolysing)